MGLEAVTKFATLHTFYAFAHWALMCTTFWLDALHFLSGLVRHWVG